VSFRKKEVGMMVVGGRAGDKELGLENRSVTAGPTARFPRRQGGGRELEKEIGRILRKTSRARLCKSNPRKARGNLGGDQK